MNFMKLNIQLFAHVKAQGSTKMVEIQQVVDLELKQQMDKLFWLVLSYIVKEEQKFIQEQMLELEKMTHYLQK